MLSCLGQALPNGLLLQFASTCTDGLALVEVWGAARHGKVRVPLLILQGNVRIPF